MIKNLLNLFFPPVCYACQTLLSDNERHICTTCRHELPVTNYHFSNNDALAKVFYGRVKIQEITALLRFTKKGKVQHLIHNLKYRGHQKIGAVLGAWLGQELIDSNRFNTIDMVIPVPLHPKKLKKRGYNQVALFGQEIASALGAVYRDDILIKITTTSTQVFKQRFARWKSGNEIFALNNEDNLAGKHVLIVDDIITTGATIEACINVLETGKPNAISVAVMAIVE